MPALPFNLFLHGDISGIICFYKALIFLKPCPTSQPNHSTFRAMEDESPIVLLD